MTVVGNDNIINFNTSNNIFVTSQNTQKSSIEVFGDSLPDITSESASDTVNKTVNQNRNFDIDALVKKYKDNPSLIFSELGINFSDEQKREILSKLTDEKAIRSFLEIAKNGALNASDIFEGLMTAVEKKGSTWLKRTGTFFKKLFSGDVEDAFEYAKSEKVYYSSKLGSNMNDIREERDDFSSQGVANVAEIVTDNPDIKDETMHFVEKEDKPGEKLYTEEDVTRAAGIMQQTPEKAEDFCNNAKELEAIKGDDNSVKYKGSTIINVSDRMTQKDELKNTMLDIARKKDMNDDFLDNTTENLFNNPDMEEALKIALSAKNKDGSDKFSAEDLNKTSEHLVDKIKEYCEKYSINLDEIVNNSTKIDSKKILELTEKITQNPEQKNKILTENNITINNKSENTVYKAQTNTSTNNLISSETNNTNQNILNTAQYTTNAINKQKYENTVLPTTETATTSMEERKAKIKTYVLDWLSTRYGTSMADVILNRAISDPIFIEDIKKYGADKEIIEALLTDRTKVQKIKASSASIDTSTLVVMLKLATNATITDNLVSLNQKYGSTTAIKLCRQSKISKKDDELAQILAQSTTDSTTKKEQIENLYS